jgi:hypothetical protein
LAKRLDDVHHRARRRWTAAPDAWSGGPLGSEREDVGSLVAATLGRVGESDLALHRQGPQRGGADAEDHRGGSRRKHLLFCHGFILTPNAYITNH